MFYWGYPDKGVCPVKGAHDAIGFNFHIPHDIAPTWTSQGEWRFCEKCKGLFFDGYNIKGVCPADRPGGHRAAGFNFVIPHDVASTETSQRDWRYCNNCYGMFFDGYPKKGVCPANGGSHLPMGFNFVNEGPFLKSIGVETVLDIDDIKAPFYHLRDNFYYRAAEAFIAGHRRNDGRPLFLEIQTMFPHSPYEQRMEPGIKVEGEPFSADSQVNEYLRRMAVARGDFQDFLAARAAEAGERVAVVLEFGDHQSSATKPLVDEIAGADAMGRLDSFAYRTFYTVTTFGHPLRRPMPDTAIDIGFVGASLFDAAGLPMSPMMLDLVRLRDRCGGRFHGCPDRAEVDRFLRRRIDSGLLHLFPKAAPLRSLAATN